MQQVSCDRSLKGLRIQVLYATESIRNAARLSCTNSVALILFLPAFIKDIKDTVAIKESGFMFSAEEIYYRRRMYTKAAQIR